MKTALKISLKACCLILALPLVLLNRIGRIFFSRERSIQGVSQFLSLFPGLFGEYLRREFYRFTLKRLVGEPTISFGTIFSTDDVEIEEGVYIGAYCIIGHAKIGRNTLLASRVSVVSGLHQHGISRLDMPIRDQPGRFEVVSIGEDCWVGEGCVVGASIGSQSVISSGSTVLSELPARVIARGNPAKPVRDRNESASHSQALD